MSKQVNPQCISTQRLGAVSMIDRLTLDDAHAGYGLHSLEPQVRHLLFEMCRIKQPAYLKIFKFKNIKTTKTIHQTINFKYFSKMPLLQYSSVARSHWVSLLERRNDLERS